MAEPLSGKMADSEEVGRACDLLEKELNTVRVAYEQYFLGLERHPPVAAHNQLKKNLQQIRNTFIRQTALKFRVSSLHNKLLTYERLWQRTLQEIESGTYKRDLFKAKLHSKRREPAQPEPAAPAPQPEASAAAEPPITQGRTAAAARNAPPLAPPGEAPGGLTDQRLKAIYDAYITAKKRCNEDTSKLTFDGLAQSLKKQVPALLKQHNAKLVDVKVIIKDGKAILRAVPKE